MRPSLLQPVNRFPGEFFLIGLVLAGMMFLLLGATAAMVVTCGLCAGQVLLIRRNGRQLQGVRHQLEVSNAEAHTWERRAVTFMEELASQGQRLQYQDHETGLGDLLQLESDFVTFKERVRKRGLRFSIALIELRPPAGSSRLAAESLFEAGQQILACARPEDSVCRVSERQFAVLLANASRAGAEAFVTRVRIQLSHLPSGAVQFYTGEAEFDRGMHTIEDLAGEAQRVLESESRLRGRLVPLLHEVA